MIEKKELGRASEQKRFLRLAFARAAESKVKRLKVLESLVHISLPGPRTRRSQLGKHGASGAEQPQETRSQEVAPRRKVGSLDRQVPRGHTSKVRCRSRCGAICSILQVERQARAEDSFGALYPTGLWPFPSALRCLLPFRPPAHKTLPPRSLEAREQAARFPAQCICPGAMNRQARWPSP